MKLTRRTAALGALAAVGLAAGCGHDPVLPPGQLPAPTPGVVCGGKSTLSAEGSSAQANAFSQFSSAFLAQCAQNNIDYNPTGSGSGVKQFTAGQVDIGATDTPLKPSEAAQADARCQSPAWHLPLVFGPIALAYNLPGVGELDLTPQVTAKIFNGSIHTWNDPEIAALNPGRPLPAERINVLYRSDESGTTANFQDYLSSAAPGIWTGGSDKAFHGVGEGKAKSQGVASAVRGTPNSITYVEGSYARSAGLGIARLDNGSGPAPPSTEASSKAIEGAQFRSGRPHDLVVDMSSIYTDRSPGAYPLQLVSYDVVCSRSPDPATGAAVKAFMTVAAGNAQDELTKAGYVPLPPNLRATIRSSVDALA